jgi:hypothetical protein
LAAADAPQAAGGGASVRDIGKLRLRRQGLRRRRGRRYAFRDVWRGKINKALIAF